MENRDELKEVNIKNRTCYYFDVIIIIKNFDFHSILINENHTKILWFKTFHRELCLVQNLCILYSMKQSDLLKFMMEWG